MGLGGCRISRGGPVEGGGWAGLGVGGEGVDEGVGDGGCGVDPGLFRDDEAYRRAAAAAVVVRCRCGDAVADADDAAAAAAAAATTVLLLECRCGQGSTTTAVALSGRKSINGWGRDRVMGERGKRKGRPE